MLWGVVEEETACAAIRRSAPQPGVDSPLLLARDRFRAFSISEVLGGVDEVASIRCEILLPEDGTREVPVGPVWPSPLPLQTEPSVPVGDLLALAFSFSSPLPSLQDLLRALFPHEASSSSSDPTNPFPIDLSAVLVPPQEGAERKTVTRFVEGGASFLLPVDLSKIWQVSRRLRNTFA